jgi:hypothetical protein
LSFIKDKTNWGAAFRFGYIRASANDFELIAETMKARLPQASEA